MRIKSVKMLVLSSLVIYGVNSYAFLGLFGSVVPQLVASVGPNDIATTANTLKTSVESTMNRITEVKELAVIVESAARDATNFKKWTGEAVKSLTGLSSEDLNNMISIYESGKSIYNTGKDAVSWGKNFANGGYKSYLTPNLNIDIHDITNSQKDLGKSIEDINKKIKSMAGYTSEEDKKAGKDYAKEELNDRIEKNKKVADKISSAEGEMQINQVIASLVMEQNNNIQDLNKLLREQEALRVTKEEMEKERVRRENDFFKKTAIKALEESKKIKFEYPNEDSDYKIDG